MHLNIHNAPDYLLQKGIISENALLSGGWTITFPDKSHPVCILVNQSGNGYVLKQPHQLDHHHIRLLDREASLFRLSQQTDEFSPLRGVLPGYVLFDHDIPALIMKFIPHDNGRAHLRREDSDPERLGRILAHAFGAAHIKINDASHFNTTIGKTVPWILYVTRVADEHVRNEPYYDLMVKVKADPVFSAALQKAEDIWEYTALTHIDSKLDNVLVDGAGGEEAWIIDWALSGLGDPMWDVANLMHSALSLWFISISFDSEKEMAESADDALFPIEKIQKFTSSLFRSYPHQSPIDGDAAEALKQKIVFYMAIAMIQNVLGDIKFEKTLSRRGLAMLDAAHSILKDPHSTIEEFL